jgi:hypothetical protein
MNNVIFIPMWEWLDKESWETWGMYNTWGNKEADTNLIKNLKQRDDVEDTEKMRRKS